MDQASIGVAVTAFFIQLVHRLRAPPSHSVPTLRQLRLGTNAQHALEVVALPKTRPGKRRANWSSPRPRFPQNFPPKTLPTFCPQMALQTAVSPKTSAFVEPANCWCDRCNHHNPSKMASARKPPGCFLLRLQITRMLLS